MSISLTEFVEYEFNRLERFLDSNAQIFEQALINEDIDNNDMSLESACYGPKTDIELACRAIFYELAVIIEHEIQIVAYRESLPRHDDDFPLFCGDTESTVGANYKKCVEKVEMALQIKVVDLPGALTVATIRDVVNALKHRKGQVERNPVVSGMRLPAQHRISIEDARNAIKETRCFVFSLHEKSGFMKGIREEIKL